MQVDIELEIIVITDIGINVLVFIIVQESEDLRGFQCRGICR